MNPTGKGGFKAGVSGNPGADPAPPNPARLAKMRAEANERERAAAAERLAKVCWLWPRRRPIVGTSAETYLHASISLNHWPTTLGYLPAHGEFPPAMIAAEDDADGRRHAADLGRRLADRRLHAEVLIMQVQGTAS